MQRTLLILLPILCLLPLGCGEDEQNNASRVTLTFWHSFVSSTIPALNELIDRFEREHPGIQIEAQYIPTGDALVQKLITAVQSGSAPDLSWVRANYMPELVQADAIYEMSEFIEGPNGLSQEAVQDIYPALRQYASWQGTLYSLPMEATNLGLLYNKEHFRDAGLDPDRPPTTWEELEAYSKRLTVDRNGDGRNERIGFMVPVVPATGPQGPYMVWQFIPFLWQAGGYMVSEDESQVLYGSEPGVQALSLWKRIYEAQNQRTFASEPIVTFASGQAAMVLDGPWNLPRYPTLLRDMDWGIAMLPAGPEKQATVVAGEYLAIFKQSEHPEEAWAFIKWMSEPEVQAFWSIQSGYLPTRASVLEVPEYQQFLEAHPANRAFVEQMAYAQAQRPLAYHALEVERNLAQAIEKATLGRRDPAEVLREATQASNRLLQSVQAAPAGGER